MMLLVVWQLQLQQGEFVVEIRHFDALAEQLGLGRGIDAR